MADSSATIIAASLSDDELTQSINKLVSTIEQQTNKMAQSFDSAVGKMTESLKRFSQAQQETTEKTKKSSKERVSTYDEETAAIQKNTRAKERNKGIEYIEFKSDVDKNDTYLVNANKDVDAQMSAILQKEQELISAKEREAEITRQIEHARASSPRGVSGDDLGWGSIHDMQMRKKFYSSQAQDINYLRQELASLLGVEEREVSMGDAQSSTYKRLAQYLKQLQEAYRSLSMDQMSKKGGFGQELAAEIQAVQRAMQKMQETMTRPTSYKQIEMLDEKTLSDISYKMQQLSRYRSGLDVDKQRDEIDKVNNKYSELQKKQQEVMGSNKRLTDSNNALTRSWNYMKNRLAFYLTVGASTQFVKQLVDVRGQYELLERSIGVLVDSAQRGSQIFAELNSMAIKSPFTTMELGAAAKQLVAYDVAAEDVVDTTRRLADMAAAVGIPIERLTYALGQIKAYGYLNSRDARMFSNAGIPLVKELADYYTKLEGRLVSMPDVYDRIKKKAIDYNDVMKVMNEMTDEGGRFFNFQEKVADTLKVRLANLTLAWNNMLNEMGKDSQGLLTKSLVTMKNLMEHWRGIERYATAIALNIGVIKAGQLAWALNATKTTVEGKKQLHIISALRKVFGEDSKMVSFARAMKSLIGKITPASIGVAALTALSIVMTKLILDYRALQKANESFNKSIVERTKESTDSINKFFESYKSELDEIGSASDVDKNKMWERMEEEIKKSTSAAQEYLRTLKDITDVNEKISAGSAILEESKRIQEILGKYADRGFFNLGGGFANDSMARDIQQYEKALRKLDEYYRKGRDKQVQQQHLQNKLNNSWIDAQKEIDEAIGGSFATINWAEIIGGATGEKAIANVRQFANGLRDAFLATEEGAKLGNQGIAFLNKGFDFYVGNVLASNDIITNSNELVVERSKSSWEEFFKKFTNEEKKQLDFYIANEQVGTDEFNNLWNKAWKCFEEDGGVAYENIKGQINDLNNREVVIKIAYQQSTDNLSPRQQIYFDKYIKPDSVQWVDYKKAYDANNEKYGKLQLKQGEMWYEYQTRLQAEYKSTSESVKELTDTYNGLTDKQSDYAKSVKAELDADEEYKKTIEEIGKDFHLDLTKDTKSGKKDVLGDAFSKVVQATSDINKRFKEYRANGVNAQDAITLATQEYGETLKTNNNILRAFGVQTKETSDVLTINMHTLKDYYATLLNDAKALGNTKGIEALEKAIAGLNVEIAKTDYKKLTEGLNRDLEKLKNEYELGVEISAMPELGDMLSSILDIDLDDIPKNIDEYASRVTERLNNALVAANQNVQLDNIYLTDEQLADYRALRDAGKLTEDAYNDILAIVKAFRDLRRKYYSDIIKQTKDLDYELADVNGKIIIKEKELARLEDELSKTQDPKKIALLNLQIQKQKNEIDELKQGIFELTSAYKALFGGVAEHSAYMTRILATNMKKALMDAERGGQDSNGEYTYTDPVSGEKVKMTKNALGKNIKQVDKELLKSQTNIKKLREAFTKGDDDIVDFAKGIEYVADELSTLGDIVSTVGNIAQELGLSEGAAETAQDLSETINGVATAAKGAMQIAAGDILGGVANVIKGAWQAVSTWMDNRNNELDRMIKQSEKNVAMLERAYKRLEDAATDALGAEEIAAKRAMISNKQAQLAAEQYNLALERRKEVKSSEKKDEQQEAINNYIEKIDDLKREIDEATKEITSDLLGEDLKSAARNFVDVWVDAWKEGETTLDKVQEKMDGMIETLINKAITSKLIEKPLQDLYKVIDRYTGRNTEEITDDELIALAELSKQTSADINEILGAWYKAREGMGIISPNMADKQLSALQQGIQGITEDTAGALEAYMNGVSQQVYLHSTLLMQIRDAVIGIDGDTNTSIQAQMLLQLQQSFTVQMAIQTVLNGWSSPDGLSVRVDMI